MGSQIAPTVPDRADVVVVGGGVMGTSAAFFLATETDLDVALLEKDTIAAGSTGDSSAILRHHYGKYRIYSEMAWWSHEFYREFEERTGQKIAHTDNPRIAFADEADTDSYAEAGYDVLDELDIPTSRHTGDELASRYEMLEFDDVAVGVTDETAGYSDGTDVAQGFARAARERGATVVTGVEVRDIETSSGSVVGVQTDEKRVSCDTVVTAAGPWTPSLMESIGVDVPIETSREQIVILEPPTDYAEAYPDLVPTTAFPAGEMYIRPDFGDGVLVATHHSFDEVDPDTFDRKPDEETLLELLERISNFVPELADAGIKGQYCGVYSMTPDGHFILDWAGPEGCLVAGGFSGHGFKHAPVVGQTIAEMVAGREPDIDVEFFSLARFEDAPHGREDSLVDRQ